MQTIQLRDTVTGCEFTAYLSDDELVEERLAIFTNKCEVIARHVAIESQACQRVAICYSTSMQRRGWRPAALDQLLIDASYCLDAVDLLTGETLHSTDDGGCAFQWTISR